MTFEALIVGAFLIMMLATTVGSFAVIIYVLYAVRRPADVEGEDVHLGESHACDVQRNQQDHFLQ